MIILVGASASGKTEVAKLLGSVYGIKKVITHTTRNMRVSEINDKDYHFVTKEQFEKMLREDAFVETTFYNENYYGSSKKEIADDKVLIVDANGLKAYTALNNPRIVTFFLKANENTRFDRMLVRGDALETAQSRIQNDRVEFADENLCKVDYLIDSEHMSLLDMAKEVYSIYTNHLKNLSK